MEAVFLMGPVAAGGQLPVPGGNFLTCFCNRHVSNLDATTTDKLVMLLGLSKQTDFEKSILHG